MNSVIGVVLNWQDIGRTMSCVDSLFADANMGKVIVADNESDGSLRKAVATHPRAADLVVIEHGENLGFAKGINPALVEARSMAPEFILVINNDAVLLDGAVGALADYLRNHENIGICGPEILNPDHTLQTRGARLKPRSGGIVQAVDSDRVSYVSWAAVMLRPQALREVGLLDERFFMYWEDVEFCLRLQEAGWQIGVCAEAKVVHELSASGRRTGSRVREYYITSLVQFAEIQGGVWRYGAPLRIFLILAKRVIQFDLRGAAAVLRASMRGVRLVRGEARQLAPRATPVNTGSPDSSAR